METKGEGFSALCALIGLACSYTPVTTLFLMNSQLLPFVLGVLHCLGRRKQQEQQANQLEISAHSSCGFLE